MQLKLYLFGAPRIERNGAPLELTLRKGLALLAYLAVTRQTHSRDTLATLLWPEKDQQSARANLRRTLYEVGQVIGSQFVESGAEAVALRADRLLWLDTEEFRRGLHAAAAPGDGAARDAGRLARLEQAAGLYTADFMAGFSLPDCPEYDDWQFFEREELRRSLAQALGQVISAYEAQAQWMEALRHARRLLALDPLEEAVQRRLMQLYAQAGQPGAALRQYEECMRILAQELDAPPDAETTALYEAIRTRRFPAADKAVGISETHAGAPPASAPPQPPPHRPAYSLPQQATPFVGRRQELAELLRRLRDPDCRLLTLVGPGGIGKTRLALRAAQALLEQSAGDGEMDASADAAPRFDDGVVFVPLQPVDSASRIVPAIADALGLQFYGNEPPQQQLFQFLQAKRLLLVLDNFEHLLEGVNVAAEILAAAPAVKLLVTSREALKLQEEWFHPLAGMRLPPLMHAAIPGAAQGPEPLVESDAVQLFVQAARRAVVVFDPSTQQDAIVRICRLVDGMPLALELAASWLKLLACAQIAAEIERGMDILVTRQQNVPARHRSMRAVLDHSWQLLSAQAQAVLSRLSVFRGGFLQDAAAVAGADLLALAELVDTAWIYRTPDGRYQMHELLRQSAAAKLAEAPHDEAETQDRHAAFYLQQAAQRQAALIGPDQRAALDAIAAEIDNLQAAWTRAVAQRAWPLVNAALHALYLFYNTRSRFAEGEEMLANALAALAVPSVVPAADETGTDTLRWRLLARLGVFQLAQGDLAAAERCFDTVLYYSHDRRELAFVHAQVGALARLRGNRPAAESALQQTITLARSSGDRNQMAEALHILSDTVASFADFEESKRLAQEALVLCRELQRPDLTARVLASTGWAVNCLGDYALSEHYYRESLAISEAIGDPYGIALSTNFLGWVAFCAGGDRLAQAVTFYAEALGVWRQIGQRTNLAMCLGDYMLAAYELGDYATALRCGQEGLAIAEQLHYLDLTSYNLYGLGAVACALGDLAVSRRNLLRSLTIAHQMQIRDNAAATLYFMAHLLVRESQTAALEPERRVEKLIQALELLALIIGHRATWQLFRDRAQRAQAAVMAMLPAEVAAAALERGGQRPFDAVVAELLDEAFA